MARRAVLLALAILGTAACAGGAPPPMALPIRETPTIRTDMLAEAIDYARGQYTTGLLIIQNGRTLFEANWPLAEGSEDFRSGFVHGTARDGALLEDVASLQKSFVAILTGTAIDKGLIDIERPVSFYIGEGWSKATREQEAGITVRHLLEMTSGLTESLAFKAPAGSEFFYNTPAYALIKGVLAKASGAPLEDITKSWLTDPLGMTETSWRIRPGRFAGVGNPTGLVTTPRDIAKLGQLVLDAGRSPSGARVISSSQLKAILSRTAANPAYGRLWWLNGGDFTLNAGAGRRVEGSMIPEAPNDLVAGQGAEARKLYVAPSLGLIIVRTGVQTPDANFNSGFWRLLAKALPPPPSAS